MRRICRAMTIALAALLPMGWAGGAEPGPGSRSDQEALKEYGSLVGSWRGVGQPQRMSPKGAWRETAEWSWRFSPGSAALEVTIGGGKYLRSAILGRGPGAGAYTLKATLADGSSRTFAGMAGERNQVVLVADGPASEGVRRLTITPLHETRFLMLLEGQESGRPTYFRLGEVGYTRQGVSFAAGDSYPLCIVTDGRGTVEVKHRGQSYWVCCSGCKDLFEDDPDAVIAEAAARRKEKAK